MKERRRLMNVYFFFYYYFKPVSQNIMFKLLLIFGSDSLSKISVDAPVTVPHTAE